MLVEAPGFFGNPEDGHRTDGYRIAGLASRYLGATIVRKDKNEA
jgi:hypothetical protein